MANRRSRNRKAEDRSFTRDALELKSPAVCLDDLLNDRKPETGVAAVPASAAIGSIEALKHPALIVLGNSSSGVDDRYLYPTAPS
jgi:hypothetical protein